MGWVYRIATGNYMFAIGDGGEYEALNWSVALLNIETNAGSTSGTSLSNDTWYHLAYTRSGNTHLAYINGTLDITHTDAEPTNAPNSLVTGVSGASFNGRVAAVKVWTAALTQPQIAAENFVLQ